jgi:hypothetical protein
MRPRKIKYGSKVIALGEDDNHQSEQSLRLALEGDRRLINKRRDSGLLSQNEKDFLARKIKKPRGNPPKGLSAKSRDYMAVQVFEYCQRLGMTAKEAAKLIREACGDEGVHRQKLYKWRDEIKASLGEAAMGWVEYETRAHGLSEEGLQHMIKKLEWLRRHTTGELEWNSTSEVDAIVAVMQSAPGTKPDDTTAAAIRTALSRTRPKHK